MTALVAGFLLGLAGSAHCAGMCGPLVLTVMRRPDPSRARLWPPLAYHAGRVLIYLLLAVAAGLAGHALSFGGLGRTVSVASGVFLLTVAADPGLSLVSGRAALFWSVVLSRACVTANRSACAHPLFGHVVAGMANGLLPCGLVYAAAIAATGLGSVSGAVLFMAGFGLGTVPMLLAISLSAASVPLALRRRLRRLAPAALVLTGMLLIVRGLMPPHHSVPGRAAPAVVSHAH